MTAPHKTNLYSRVFYLKKMNTYRFLFILMVGWISASSFGQTISRNEPLRFLALGDSYTIGQSVNESERWPIQMGESLKSRGIDVQEINIIARTGWRTDNLRDAINSADLTPNYDLVSLLIGVNNQYQRGSIATYSTEFETLLQTAIELGGGQKSKVMVVSIPDYSYTPFGQGSASISREIDEFNAVNRDITSRYGVTYHNITPISRRGLAEPNLVADDGLHPSGEMYRLWVEQILADISFTDDTSIEESLNQLTVTAENGYLTLTLPQKADLKIHDITGKLVLFAPGLAPQQNHGIRLSGWDPGFYIVTMESNQQIIASKKIIIQAH
jgi:lysophospholipase L1-like esterase